MFYSSSFSNEREREKRSSSSNEGHALLHTLRSTTPPPFLYTKTRQHHPLTTCSSFSNTIARRARVPCPRHEHINKLASRVQSFPRLTVDHVDYTPLYSTTIKMASMNYCFTVCRAAEEKAQQEQHLHAGPSNNIDVPQSVSPNTGAYFFGRFFSFGSTPPASAMMNPFTVKASEHSEAKETVQ